uniref:Uncharacterized protein n=2 Tax=Guillardia theta TaxID=55529 RepID=A0A7S4L171_GUITH|mmetsp:Transcript_35478/g.110977  ORF Transcript_35478/g.110977 Transcript_35478/m.110977 type:complete len:142 (+) Transcript_35478:330-755(+)
MSTAEIALDLAAKAEREISANSEVNHTVWLQPKESPNSNGLKQAGSGRKVIRASGREGLYDNDKYSARTRGGDIWSSFSIYFGRGGADALPLPVGARTKNMSPSSMGNVILMLSLIVAAVIVYLAVNHWIPVQFGASLHAK